MYKGKSDNNDNNKNETLNLKKQEEKWKKRNKMLLITSVRSKKESQLESTREREEIEK